jgi:hypothetical protein
MSARFDTQKFGSGVAPEITNLAVKAGSHVKAGSIAMGNSSGTCEPGTSAAGLVCLGRSEGDYDNTASLDPAPVARVASGIFGWDQHGTTIDAGKIGKTCYVYDEHTVTLDSSSRSPAGVIVGIADDGKVMVATSPAFAFDTDSDDGTTYPILSVEKTIVAGVDTVAGQGTGADTNGTARVYNVGAALPDGAVLAGYSVHRVSAFGAENTTLAAKLGATGDDDSIMTTVDLKGAAGYTQGTPGDDYVGLMPSAPQVLLTLTPDVASKVSAAVTGEVKVKIFYIDATDA